MGRSIPAVARPGRWATRSVRRWTPLQPATKPGEGMPEFGGNTPLGRAGQPSELAGAFVFLASPLEASYVSGTVLGVTGGRPVF